MPTLTQAARNRILNYFDQSKLTIELFEFVINKGNKIIQIIYKPNSNFKLTINKVKDNFISIESPGLTLLEQEKFELRNSHEIETRVREWIRRIEDEIIIDQQSSDYLNNLRQKLDQLIEDIDNPDKPFSKSEASTWEEKFANIVDQFDELKDKLNIQEHDIAQLKQEIKKMNSVSSKMPRNIWLKSVGSKIIDWIDKKFDRALDKAIETSIIAVLSPPK